MDDYKLFYKEHGPQESFFVKVDGQIVPKTALATRSLSNDPLKERPNQEAPIKKELPPKEFVNKSLSSFDKEIRVVLGPEISAEQVQELYYKFSGDSTLAIRHYFESIAISQEAGQSSVNAVASGSKSSVKRFANEDGNFADSKKPKIENVRSDEDKDGDKDEDKNIDTDEPEPAMKSKSKISADQSRQWTEKHLGSYQAEVMAKLSGRNLVEFGDELVLERFESKKNNIAVNVINKRTRKEFARLRAEDAKIIATLIETQTCRFSATCIFADSFLRVGDSIYIEVQCYILKSAFTASAATSTAENDNRVETFFDNTKETLEERRIRLRRDALGNLLSSLDLCEYSEQTTSSTASTSAPGVGHDQLTSVTVAAEDADNEGEEMTQDEIDSLYQRSAPPDAKFPGVDPPDTFVLNLREYQRKGLQWMLERESDEKTSSAFNEGNINNDDAPMDPLWTEVTWPDHSGKFYANLHNGGLRLDLPRVGNTARGGILADEMGLGKTISTLALIHSSRKSTTTNDFYPLFAAGTTLIIAPMSLLAQWESEALRSAKDGTLNVYLHYGQGFSTDMSKLVKPDIVVTTYGTLHSDYRRLVEYRKMHDFSPEWFPEQAQDAVQFGIFAVKFHRIVLDEGHNIRNRTTISARACNELRSEKRWILTGTPIVNKLEDLFSLIKFLRISPWNNFALWRTSVTMPFQMKSKKGKAYVRALKVVQNIMEPILLRRTKNMKMPNGDDLVTLPPKTVIIQRIKFSEDESDLYAWIFSRVKGKFKDSILKGDAGRMYNSILQQILRLRQTCCHPSLAITMPKYEEGDLNADDADADGADKSLPVTSNDNNDINMLDIHDSNLQTILQKFNQDMGSPEEDERLSLAKYSEETLKEILEGKDRFCPICTDTIVEQNQVVTKCLHFMCLDCLTDYMDHIKKKGTTPKCPLCEADITESYTIERQNSSVYLKKRRPVPKSAKIRALMNCLQEQNVREKTVVFSQFTSFLTLIERELQYAGFPTLRFDGTMSQKQRASILRRFSQDTKPYILLISLKAGGVGLNLVAAKQAYLMDPWWNFAIESQAIDRIHRMGQTAPVTVTRFIVEGTVEETILKIQERKSALATTLGMTKEEQKEQRLKDIKLLFED